MNPTTQKSILDFIAAHGRRPSQISKDPSERRLCYSMYRLIGTDNPQDSELRQTIDSLVPPKRRVKERKEWILEWCCVHGKRPGHSDAPQLYTSMIRYITPKYKTFDPDFKANLDALCPSRREQQRGKNAEKHRANKQMILNWILSHPVPEGDTLSLTAGSAPGFRRPS